VQRGNWTRGGSSEKENLGGRWQVDVQIMNDRRGWDWMEGCTGLSTSLQDLLPFEISPVEPPWTVTRLLHGIIVNMALKAL
jgi:hypothetical protein